MVKLEVGMFELQANLLKTRVFDDVRKMPVETRECRMCHKNDESVAHIVSGCSLWSFTYYLERHDSALRPLCWWVRQRYGIDDVMKAWHLPVDPDPVVENEEVKIWWNVPILSDSKLKHNQPDMRVWLKKKRKLFVVEMCCPWDARVFAWEKEKEAKYKAAVVELAVEYQREGVEVVMVVLVIGALGTIVSLEEELMKIIGDKKEVRFVAERMQRACVTKTLKAVNKFKAV